MPISCPRCATDVPNEALYCPYCNLQKPKRGFAVAAESKKEDVTTDQEPRSQTASKRNLGYGNVGSGRQPKPPRKLRVPVLGVAGLVALVGVGLYIFVVPLVHSEEAEPKSVLAALNKLKQTPSNEPGLSIDARLQRELERSRRAGSLVGYQGWVVQPVKGAKTKVLLVFSYQEVGDIHQRAEWLADLAKDTFTPQSDLAASVFNK